MKAIVVQDKMQSGYRYQITEPVGKKFDSAFAPQLTPPQLLRMGIFGGKYMCDCGKEYPESWFAEAKLSPEGARAAINFFGVIASMPLGEWRRKGWIHPDDPRGWFQWYCRYYMGRRHEDDSRQINRWRAIRRHLGALKKHCSPLDHSCRPKQRQALLHWAYDTRNW